MRHICEARLQGTSQIGTSTYRTSDQLPRRRMLLPVLNVG